MQGLEVHEELSIHKGEQPLYRACKHLPSLFLLCYFSTSKPALRALKSLAKKEIKAPHLVGAARKQPSKVLPNHLITCQYLYFVLVKPVK